MPYYKYAIIRTFNLIEFLNSISLNLHRFDREYEAQVGGAGLKESSLMGAVYSQDVPQPDRRKKNNFRKNFSAPISTKSTLL